MTTHAMTGYDDRVDRARRYFTETVVLPVESPAIRPMIFLGAVAFIAAVVIGLIGSMRGTFALLVILLGVVGVSLAGAGLLRYGEYRHLFVASSQSRSFTEPKATDQDMDRWLEADVNGIVRDGLARLALPATSRPPHVALVGVAQSPSVLGRRGRDTAARFSAYQVLVLYLRDSSLSAFECQLDAVTGQTSQWQTKEYPLKCIDGVEIFSDTRRHNFLNEGLVTGVVAHRPRTHVRVSDTQGVRVVVSGRLAIGIEVTLSRSAHKNLSTISRAQLDQKATQLRNHLRRSQA